MKHEGDITDGQDDSFLAGRENTSSAATDRHPAQGNDMAEKAIGDTTAAAALNGTGQIKLPPGATSRAPTIGKTVAKAATDGAIVRTTEVPSLANKTVPSPIANSGVSRAVFPHRDKMSPDVAAKLPNGQSIEAYLRRLDPGMPPGSHRLPYSVTGVIADKTPDSVAVLHGWPFFVARSTALDVVRLHLVTALSGVEAMSGIYDDREGYPGSLLEDLGTVDLSEIRVSSRDFAATTTVAGWFWVMVWMKNVATPAMIRGPNSLAAAGFMDVQSNARRFFTHGYLALASAYPESMPDPAPANMTRQTGLNAPVPMIRAA